MDKSEKDALKLGLGLHERMVSQTASLTHNLASGAFVREAKRVCNLITGWRLRCEYNRDYETVQSLLDRMQDIDNAIHDLVDYQENWVERLFGNQEDSDGDGAA